jgi:hypothetical protein
MGKIRTHQQREADMTSTWAPPTARASANGAVNDPPATVPTTRTIPDNATVLSDLGLLRDLGGTWQGQGFNLIARPDQEDAANLYLQLSQTQETLTITPIGSPIPNRGFGQGDIDLFGLSYLQQISDRLTGGALHLEPGLWITQPATDYPAEEPPANGQIVARMGSIPHGTTILAQGNALPFTDPPTLPAGGLPTGSVFPSFNSTPFVVGEPINAFGSSEKLTAEARGVLPFTEYDLTIPESANNPRTPFKSNDPPLPVDIDGVAMQDAINDPIRLLQTVIQRQADAGYTFQGVALNIATAPRVDFLNEPNNPQGPQQTVEVADGGGNADNILFLEGGEPAGPKGPNAETDLVYATFWITRVTPTYGDPFMQLQYAQMTMLNFPILAALPTVINLSWPHISVATLRKSFG